MLLDLKKVLLHEGEVVPFQYEFSLSSTDIGGAFPFVSPISVSGCARHYAGTARLRADVSFDFSIPCDRCADQLSRRYEFSFEHVLVSSLNDEENDEYVQLEDGQIDLDELLRADILLELPAKHLCTPGCKGLCPECGRNLNREECLCPARQADPRLEILRKLIE